MATASTSSSSATAKSPPDFALEDARYLDLETQRATGLAYADLCPEAHYARKNIGYLIAMQAGVPLIVETDDDNLPASGFFAPRVREQRVSTAQACGWVNVYRYFAEGTTWPRGLPLDEIMRAPAPYDSLAVDVADCPIQQGLADDNPDVDAVYRPCQPLPVRFRRDRRLALGRDAWCPFNSQNTAWWPDAYPLLYLPATCSFRMTDIWRSFVAQRIAWVNGWFEPDLEQPARVTGRLVRLVEIRRGRPRAGPRPPRTQPRPAGRRTPTSSAVFRLRCSIRTTSTMARSKSCAASVGSRWKKLRKLESHVTMLCRIALLATRVVGR